MKTAKVFHNPRCGKCRQVLQILEESGFEVDLIDYQKGPPTLKELQELRSLTGNAMKDFIRTKEEVFKSLDLSLDDEDALAEAIQEYPILLERPIVVIGDRAIVARPAEKVLSII